AKKILAEHRVELDLAGDLPMVELDAVLFEQVLFNLLDNAAKYSPYGTTVCVRSWRDESFVYLQVLDEGWHPAGRSGAYLRQILPGQESRSCSRWNGAGACDLARLRRSDERHDRRGKPAGAAGRGVHHSIAGRGAITTVGHRRMTAAALKVLVIDDEPPIRK